MVMRIPLKAPKVGLSAAPAPNKTLVPGSVKAPMAGGVALVTRGTDMGGREIHQFK
jgi:hypothetical protein